MNDKSIFDKSMLIMLFSVGLLFAGVFGYKAFKNYMIQRFLASQSYTATVSTMKAESSWWQTKMRASGSVRAIQGVNVTTELAALVKTIYFTPGSYVKQGTVLVQLNADSDIALLHSLQASAELARITYERDKKQYAIKAVSKQQLDTDFQNLKNQQAQVAQQIAIVEKKTIRAPFSGHLGISAVNPGQYLNVGDKVVTLQTLDPVYVDFYVPQQVLPLLSVNQPVTVTADSYPDVKFKGKITTIDPLVDVNTRNVEVEATIENPKYQLTPGMFGYVEIETGKPQRYITLPQTAISFNPYGSVVYIVDRDSKDAKGIPILTVKQRFVTTGDTRGEQITVLSGLKDGEEVVTSGQLKLKNGSQIAINNSIVPSNSPDPAAPNEY